MAMEEEEEEEEEEASEDPSGNFDQRDSSVIITDGPPFVYSYIDDFVAASSNTVERKAGITFVFDRHDKSGVSINLSNTRRCAAAGWARKRKPQGAKERVPVAPEDIPKTVVTTPFGLFGFIGVTFGIRNVAQTFQRFIDPVLRGLPFVHAYIDDLLVASRNAEEHKVHLAFVFDRLDKCVLDVPSLKFLGHLVDSEGLLELSGEALTAFERIKNFLADATLLTHPAPEVQLFLMVDASSVAVGAVLQQHLVASALPLAFFSKKLSPAETRYSTFGRELLAIRLTVKHFRHFFEGPDFIVFTHNKPLTFASRSRSDKYNPKEVAHLDYIFQFTSDIRQ
ncbi:hypothetical protein SprV_0100392700 [Sparganum proliferum]